MKVLVRNIQLIIFLEMLENDLDTYTLQKLSLRVCRFFIFCENCIPRSCCFVINRENEHTSKSLRYLSWHEKYFLFSSFVLLDLLREQIHIKHLINWYLVVLKKIFILISHFYTIVLRVTQINNV